MDFGTTNDNKKYLKILYDLFGLDGRVEDAAKSTNFSVIFADWIRTYNVTTGSAGDVTGTLFPLIGSHRRIRFVKVDVGTSKFILAGDGADPIGVEGVAATFDLYAQGDWVEAEDMGTYWSVVGTNGPELAYVNNADTAIAGAASGTWYNPAAHSLAIAAGKWEALGQVSVLVIDAASTSIRARATLALNNAAPDDGTVYGDSGTGTFASATLTLRQTFSFTKRLVATAAATLYLLIFGDSSAGGGLTSLATGGATANSVIRVRRIG